MSILAFAIMLLIPQTSPQQAHQEPYKVDVVSPSQDTPLFPVYLILTAIGIAVNGGVLIAILRQNRINREAVNAAKDAATAASLNAKAVINSERAWVIPRIVRIGSYSSMLTISNVGRTPAEIIGVVERTKWTKLGEDLPETPNYGLEEEFIQKRILSPSDPPWEYTNFRVDLRTEMPDDMRKEVESSKLRYWKLGYVRYRNVVNKDICESRFCYFYSPPLDTFLIGGPSEYTKYS